MMSSCTIHFPQRISNTAKFINFILNLYKIFRDNEYSSIKLDFRDTVYFETNLLAVLSYFIEEFSSKGIRFRLIISAYLEKEQEVNTEDVIDSLFELYSEDYSLALRPRKIGNRYPNESNRLLLDDLKMLNLKEYGKVKILLSELFANLKMHTLYQEGVYAGFHNYKENTLVFSVVNYDITIANQILRKRSIEFEDDFNAVVWALRKHNSTRYHEEAGGLGLYLLRKYINHLEGRIIIISGKCYLEFDKSCYNESNENAITIKKHISLVNRYEGTIITMIIPDEWLEKSDEDKVIDYFDLKQLEEYR
ncbi:MAG: hypothetical protein UHN47_11025 [Lachnospiraceae bacterium]|nr:hypothetical protein [Lachnospiraceae bacterium]